jgi:predicted phage terminase large subunit-like protein
MRTSPTSLEPAEAFKAALSGDFLSFARRALLDLDGTRIGADHYLSYLARELSQFAKDETRRLIINLPPGHLKTMLGSVCTTAWLLGHKPSLKVIIVTHAETLSKTIARNIRTVIQSRWFKDVFATRIKPGHAEVTDYGTNAGGGVFVTSFSGRFTGHRADVIVVDDPHDIGDSLDEIEKTTQRFHKVVLSRLNNRKTGRVLIIAHRVHERDLSASLLPQKMWKHVVLSIVATRNQTYQTTTGKWHRRKGELLRPDAFGPQDLEELRANCFNPDFDILYQQDVDSQALPAISADHFPTATEPPPSSTPIVLSVDAGMTKGSKSAFSVIQAWRVMPNRFYLIDQFREQCDYATLRGALGRFRKRYRPAAILIERAANGNALISDLSPKYRDLIIPIEPDGRSKSARLGVHAETIIAKRIHLPADEPWRDDFVAEFVEFPHGRFTDQVDATTQFLDRAPELAKLEPRRQAGSGVLARNSSAPAPSSCWGVVGSSGNSSGNSSGSERGLAAGRFSDGRPMTVRFSK